MKTYPSIERNTHRGASIYAFDKLDGSNIRAEWNKKKGFWKFGRRHGLLDDSNPKLLEAPDLIRQHEAAFAQIFTRQRWQDVVAFFEFYGPQSFAGNHAEEPHQVSLIDLSVDKRGIISPRDFHSLTDGVVPSAKLLYHGVCDADFESGVRSGTLEGMTFEGVVCKGSNVSPGRPLMFKIKNQAWIDRLKEKCGDDVLLFEKLL